MRGRPTRNEATGLRAFSGRAPVNGALHRSVCDFSCLCTQSLCANRFAPAKRLLPSNPVACSLHHKKKRRAETLLFFWSRRRDSNPFKTLKKGQNLSYYIIVKHYFLFFAPNLPPIIFLVKSFKTLRFDEGFSFLPRRRVGDRAIPLALRQLLLRLLSCKKVKSPCCTL